MDELSGWCWFSDGERRSLSKIHFFRGGKAICGASSKPELKVSGSHGVKCEHCLGQGTHNVILSLAGYRQTFRFLSASQRRGFKQGVAEALRASGYSEPWTVRNMT